MAFQQLYQNDARWANTPIGLQSQLTISDVGCLLTSMTMVMNYFGAGETPASLNDKMKASNGFNGAWIKSFQVLSQFPQLGVKRQKRHVRKDDGPVPMDLLDESLEAGSLVVVRVDWTPNDAIDSHWVVLHKKAGDDYEMWDPWQKEGASDTLAGRYGFGGKKAADIILEAIWHGKDDLSKITEGDAEAAPAQTPPPPTQTTKTTAATGTKAVQKKVASGEPLFVRPTATQLTVRRQPQITESNIIKAVTPSDTLQVLEEAGTAQGKIGQQNQWLHVKAGSDEGYVAAWYVQKTAAPAQPAEPPSPEPEPESTPPPPDLWVKVSAISVSFRSAPRVADDTLISYLNQGTELKVVESGDASVKIGQQNQWLNVQAKDGTKGYIAAWLVHKK